MTPDEVESLRARHRDYVRAQLRGDAAKKAWESNVAAAIEHLWAQPVSVLLDSAAADALIEHVVDPETLATAIRPIIKSSMQLTLARWREDQTPLGASVPEDARATINKLLARPKLVPKSVVRAIITHDAVETGMRDILFDGMREFMRKVNPFSGDGGIGSTLGKLSPFGLGSMAKSIDNVQKEFDKRMEPELRRYLQTFARQALSRLAEFATDRADEPAFVEMRRELFSWLLEQPVAELVEPASEPTAELGEKAAFEISRHVLAAEGAKRRRRALLDMIAGAHGKQTLQEALAVYGVTHRPDAALIAAATWPLLKSALEAPAIEGWIVGLVDGFYDEL